MESSTARPLPAEPRGSLLIVDDELPLLEAISRYLGRQGYAVQTAVNGRDALARLADAPVDVMLCDVGLPDMEAPALVTAARETAPEMVVLMFSGWHDQQVADRLIAAGASAYVTKPMPLRELRDIVDQAVVERRTATHLNHGS
jgi:DNA-binding NtrC family response regulator